MNTYEISNPSDPITIQADDDMVAAAAGLLLGEGRYGIKRDDRTILPIFLLGGFEEWAAEHKFGDDYITAHKGEIAACLRTAAIGEPPTDIRRCPARLMEWNEERRSSLTNIAGRAHQIAARMWPLHVFTIGPDTYVAHDPDDVWRCIKDHTGWTRETAEYDDEEPVQVPDAQVLRIRLDEDRPEVEARSAAEWCVREGRGWLCSSEA